MKNINQKNRLIQYTSDVRFDILLEVFDVYARYMFVMSSNNDIHVIANRNLYILLSKKLYLLFMKYTVANTIT